MGAKIRGVVCGQNLHECILQSCLNLIKALGILLYRNSDLGEGIVCLGEDSGDKGEGSEGKRGGKWGERGREVRLRREGSRECLPPCPSPLIWIIRVHFYCFICDVFI